MPNSTNSIGFYDTLCADMNRYGCMGRSPFKMAACLVIRSGFPAVFFYRLSAVCINRGIVGRLIAKLIWRINILLNGCDINPSAVIGAGLHLPHPGGIVIGHATIGCHVMILHNTTLGIRHFSDDTEDARSYPTIGDNVHIGSGAAVFGGVTVGEGVTIGANAVVLKDIRPHSTAVGIPAREVTSHNNSAHSF